MDFGIDSIINALANLLNALISFVYDFVLWFLESMLNAVLSILDFVFNFLLWILDFVSSIFDGLGVNTDSAWMRVTTKTLYVLHEVDVFACAQVIICFIVIRLILNLVPTWATRV
jgi:hypothetical protein